MGDFAGDDISMPTIRSGPMKAKLDFIASLIEPGRDSSCLLGKSQAKCTPVPPARKYRASGENVISISRPSPPSASDVWATQVPKNVGETKDFLVTRVASEATSISASSNCEFRQARTDPSGASLL